MNTFFLDDLQIDSGNIEDYLPQEDTGRLYTCKFCATEFRADGDTSEMVRHYTNYGCGCLPDCIIDAGRLEAVKLASMQTAVVKITAVNSSSYRNEAGFNITFGDGTRVKLCPPSWDSDNRALNAFLERKQETS